MQATTSLNLPTTAYRQLERAAQRQQRSVEELIEAFAAAQADIPALEPDLETELEAMAHLSDHGLLKFVRPDLTGREQEELETLHFVAQRDGLTGEQQGREKTLLDRYERGLLLRSRALQLLKQRGIDITTYLNPPTQ